ncbi:hypothetical protein BDB13_6274 [Rhodococcus sp. OK302]|jgi:hypothetical protein|nr:hypothetical protein BDB13_6274 [Rhodococcus sp. OK302]
MEKEFDVVVFFEVLFVLASIAMLWFAAYVVYRLVTDERR